jgi:hypothetical protein
MEKTIKGIQEREAEMAALKKELEQLPPHICFTTKSISFGPQESETWRQ